MTSRGPHISIPHIRLLPRVFNLTQEQVDSWPESVRSLAVEMAAELFLLRYNPFIAPDMVRNSVNAQLSANAPSLDSEYATALEQAVDHFWQDYEAEQNFKSDLIKRLQECLPTECINNNPNALVECSTDATDLRLELPLLVVAPENTEQVQCIIRLANEMGFSIVPRGGGSGLTGGAIPAGKRTVMLSLSRMKNILSIDKKEKKLCAQSGVITLNAIQAAAGQGLLFTVDPASKAASSLGGNISENAGGPFAFEYGTTLDNILSYVMVLPSGDCIEVRRKNHPLHKILPNEDAVFEVLDDQGQPRETISLHGSDIRGENLGKDVSNKFLGGLPGIQKEGVDGIITEACFILHPMPAYSRTLCLEFYGRSMHPAMLVINDLVAMRDTIREQGDLVKMSALEEFGTKYVQAIEYQKKSSRYEGDPISVLLIQMDSDDEAALDGAVGTVVDIVGPYENVDVFVASDSKQAEIFWEDRHRLSAITRRTSGFKINEDIVIPLKVIPEFSDFLEHLNLRCLAKAYRRALQEVAGLQGVADQDEFVEMELDYCARILKDEITAKELSDQEFEIQTQFFFQDLRNRYPRLQPELDEILTRMRATRIIVANHMHAGDGNCHVNIPVNSNDPQMLHQAEEAAGEVFKKVLELKGAVSGEHGIGITKIAFLPDEKIQALKAYKNKVDPKNIINPGKLTLREQPSPPYTFSFNRLIQDLSRSGLPERDRLIRLLTNIQTCSRCGKCKQVCPMYLPAQGLLFHPRNKNISLGAMIEAIYYTQTLTGQPEQRLLKELGRLMQHCTGCGKCTSACPVKINTPDVVLELRGYLQGKGADGHPFKNRIMDYLAKDPPCRLPRAAKFMAVAQNIQNKAIGLVPTKWRQRAESPLLRGKGPQLEFRNLSESLSLGKGSIFIPAGNGKSIQNKETVLYFPGCGAGLFFRSIGLATISLLLKADCQVILPESHLCCGYPLLAGGSEKAFQTNKDRNVAALTRLLNKAKGQGFTVSHIITACGSCREGVKDYHLAAKAGHALKHQDSLQFLLQRLAHKLPESLHAPGPLLYHAACHNEWSGVEGVKSGKIYAEALSKLLKTDVRISPHCCGESGLGAMTSPAIYNKLRRRKTDQLRSDIEQMDSPEPILVGCPSCRIGLTRCLQELGQQKKVVHTMEYMAGLLAGEDWEKNAAKEIAQSRFTQRNTRT
ncbi:FAD/FMN-containing dehydrogenase [Desulfonatronum thiosulfatophilum]|uniref:FAD/FMN-containing dehydrogenase n=1 Tax=Desulfonatronum thiosulfatophilum TaxID=617002 RepID=A0A1G6BAR4_9BACT|nr:FAD-binding and (Fe-S)-binding domain-containing protein [Desulfonatronum thiosulfatophilum]SDB17690.1 FAD/FMN-containing dehydrogenase [Desulfonatronum thiosulfatophilum]